MFGPDKLLEIFIQLIISALFKKIDYFNKYFKGNASKHEYFSPLCFNFRPLGLCPDKNIVYALNGMLVNYNEVV